LQCEVAVTPKSPAVASVPAESTRDDHSPNSAVSASGVELILIEERDDAVYFARVRNLGKLMSGRKMQVHKDVLEHLADLVIALVGEEGSDGSDSLG
jgi:hypothetical protein